MDRSSLETTDIFKGAFYMCMGGNLADVQFRQNHRQIASFLFSGPNLNKHDRDYMNGKALVNPLQFREALTHLRDILFEHLRHKGRYENDRKRENRIHQAYCRP